MNKIRHATYLLGKSVINVSKRSLFSDKFTFLEGFIKLRLNVKTINEIEFKHEMEYATIPKLLHLTTQWTLAATRQPDHIDILRLSLKRLHENCSEIQEEFDVEKFNQLAQSTMRLFDHLKLPDEALQFYNEFDNCYFDSASASFILMNLLFKQNRYDDVLKVYRTRTVERQRVPTTLHKTLVYAACYKLNTPESLQYSLDVRKTCKNVREKGMGRYFEAMLAINQNQFELALNLANYDDFVAKNIKLLSMAHLNDWPGVCDLLYEIKSNRLNGIRYRVTTDVLQGIKQSLDLAKPNLTIQEYNRCYRFIQEFLYLGKLVLYSATIDEILCQPIERNRPTKVLQ